MTPDQWKKLDDLFDGAQAVPQGQREAFARERCAGAPELLAELLSLLRADHSDEALLAEPIGNVAPLVDGGAPSSVARDDPLLGQRLGAYTITGIIGRGGMGVVYEARQDSPQRTVALKVVRPGAMSPSAARRFQHEAEVLGRLQHPGIALVHEAGWAQTPQGRQPYFALELVRGQPLLEYVQSRALSVRGRLSLFASVCDAVQHAHAKGVIHRDLKPGNILVDESGQPKILDFGIARLTDSDLRATTLQTDIGQLIGTVPYMSPEQASGDTRQLDTRSDVYALGVVFFEMLSGHLPYDLHDKPIPEAVRVISDQDPTKLSSVSRVYRGDIETIAAKALEKDKARRYQTAADLAADIRRYLADQAILARPATASYQLRKFARRNRVLVGGVAAALILLVAGVIGTSIGMASAVASARTAKEETERAKTEARKAGKSIDFLVEMLTSASPEETEGREVSVRELLDTAAGRLGQELADEPEVRQTIESAIGRTFEAIGKTDSARAHLETATSLARELHGAGSSQEGVAILHETAVASHERRWADMQALSERAVMMLGSGQNKRQAADAYGQLGFALGAQRKNDEAIPALRESLRLYNAAGVPSSTEAAEVTQHLGVTLGRKGGRAELAEGEALLKGAVALREKLNGPTKPRYADAVHALASFYYTQSRSEDARPLFELALPIYARAFGESDRRTLEVVSALGRTYMQLGDLDKAEEFGLRAVNGLRATGEGETAEAAAALSRLGSLYSRRKNLAAAEQYHRQALELRRKLGHVDLTVSMAALAAVLGATDRGNEAVALLREAIELERQRGFPRADAATFLGNLARLLARLNRAEEAEAAYGQALSFARERMPDHEQRGSIELDFASWLLKHQRPADAVVPAQNACDVYRKLGGDRLPVSLGVLAQALDTSGRAAEAQRVRQEIASLTLPLPANTGK